MATPRAQGADAVLLGAFETTYGTAPDGSGGGVYRRLPFITSNLGGSTELGNDDPVLGRGRDQQDPYYEPIVVDGSIRVPMDERSIGFWLRALFGAPVTTEDTPGVRWSHAFTAGGDVPTMTLETAHAGLATPAYFRHGGVTADSIEFEMARSGRAAADIALIAQGETAPASAVDGSPLEYTLNLFSAGRGEIRVNGSAVGDVTGGRFAFSNALDRVETIRADGLIAGADPTIAAATGSVDVRFSDATTLRAAGQNETPVAMTYSFTAAGASGHGITFTMPRVFLPRRKAEISGPGGVQATYDWSAAKDDSAGYMLRVTLVNDVSSYA